MRGGGGGAHSTRNDQSLNLLIQGPGYFLKSLLKAKGVGLFSGKSSL